jgi:heterotetrameric sarcosine oxidase gamma subunit
VPDDAPIARSPIAPAPPVVAMAGWAVSGRRSDSDLTLTDCTPLAKAMLRGTLDGEPPLGVSLGSTARQQWGGVEVLVAGRRPAEWLAIAPIGVQPQLVNRLAWSGAATGGLVTVIDLTHGLALIRVTGGRSADLLARECAVDLTSPAFPHGTACRTAVAGLACDIVRDDQDGTSSYLLGCERSVGQYLFDALHESGADLGVDVDGLREDRW